MNEKYGTMTIESKNYIELGIEKKINKISSKHKISELELLCCVNQ